MSRYRYGVELYSVKNELARDMPQTLKRLRAMGYEGVEFAQGLDVPAGEIRKALETSGLACCGWHTGWNLVQDDRIDSTIAYFKAVGNRYAIVPGMPDELTATPEKARETAGTFNRISTRLNEHGIFLGYHNHASELHFYPDSNECPFTAFFDHTVPSVVVQIDNGHVVNGRGMGILSLLRRYPGRYRTVHLKPYSLEKGAVNAEDGYNTTIGQDDVPWMDFMHSCRTKGGTEWYIVEYESSAMFPELDGVDEALKALRKMEADGEI